jgi:hypothetical protein
MVIAQDFPPSSPKYEMIRIPRLSAIVRGVIDRPGFSFSAYMSQQPGGPTEVHSWINQIFGGVPRAGIAAFDWRARIVAARRRQRTGPANTETI